MKTIVVALLAIGFLLPYSSDDNNKININEQNFLVFGHFYGECFGEQCVETFKLTDKSLFEDTIDNYSGQHTEFVELEKDLFEQVKDITDFFPNQLLNQNETLFGCPDCTDAGGLFIQYSENGNIKSWRIDQNKSNVPDYLHHFMDKVNEKIALLETKITTKKNCDFNEIQVYLNDSDSSGTNIRKSPNGKIMSVLRKNKQNSEYLITLTEAKQGWFKIKSPIEGTETDIDIPNGYGWIHGSVISVDTRNYGGQNLKLLDKPKSGKTVKIIEKEALGLTLVDMCDNWVKVNYNGHIGWIEDRWLCGNPYTNCS